LEAIRSLSAQMGTQQTQCNNWKKQIQAPQKQSAQPTLPLSDPTASPASLNQSRVASNTFAAHTSFKLTGVTSRPPSRGCHRRKKTSGTRAWPYRNEE